MALSLESLEVLDAIERKGSFAAAAHELGKVPSALTYVVRKLEDDLDVLLFDRRRHRAELTPAGRALLDEVLPFLPIAGERGIAGGVRQRRLGWGHGWTPYVTSSSVWPPVSFTLPTPGTYQ